LELLLTFSDNFSLFTGQCAGSTNPGQHPVREHMDHREEFFDDHHEQRRVDGNEIAQWTSTTK
jgi:hypothetical protein